MAGDEMPFRNPEGFRRILRDLPAADERVRELAAQRNSVLTKPPGALGRLERLAIWYASWRGELRPFVMQPQIIIFAGNHGVAAQGVSAFPMEVTAEMVANFNSGGAAINQLARELGVEPDVHALNIETPTGDISCEPAMSEAGFTEALLAGWQAVSPTADLLIPGEMGIGNTTSAAALAHALFGGAASDWTGAGTGVGGGALERKIQIVARAVERNGPFPSGCGLDALCRLGGSRACGDCRSDRAGEDPPDSGGAGRIHLLRRGGGPSVRGRGRAGACHRRAPQRGIGTRPHS